jgi:hypothetical protein
LAKGIANHQYFWIGMVLHRYVKDGKLQGKLISGTWVDGSAVNYGDPVKNPGKFPWGEGQPSNNLYKSGNGEVCVQIRADTPFVWNDASCEWDKNEHPKLKYGFVCEKQ